MCFTYLLNLDKNLYITHGKITYHTFDNKTHTIDVQNGLTVMEGAVQNDIQGINADYGGGMACALAMFMSKKNG